MGRLFAPFAAQFFDQRPPFLYVLSHYGLRLFYRLSSGLNAHLAIHDSDDDFIAGFESHLFAKLRG
jgi:hypothetical protein